MVSVLFLTSATKLQSLLPSLHDYRVASDQELKGVEQRSCSPAFHSRERGVSVNNTQETGTVVVCIVGSMGKQHSPMDLNTWHTVQVSKMRFMIPLICNKNVSRSWGGKKKAVKKILTEEWHGKNAKQSQVLPAKAFVLFKSFIIQLVRIGRGDSTVNIWYCVVN